MAQIDFPRKSGGVITAYYDDGDPVVEPLAAAGLLSLCSHRHGEMYVFARLREGGEIRKVALARIILGITDGGRTVLTVFKDGDALNYRRDNLAVGKPNQKAKPVRVRVVERVESDYEPYHLSPEYLTMTPAESARAHRYRQRIADTIGADVLAAWMAEVGARTISVNIGY